MSNQQEIENPINEPNKRTVLIWSTFILIGIGLYIARFPIVSELLILISSAGLSAYSLKWLLILKGTNKINLLVSLGGLTWLISLIIGAFFMRDMFIFSVEGLTVFCVTFIVLLIVYRKSKTQANNS